MVSNAETQRTPRPAEEVMGLGGRFTIGGGDGEFVRGVRARRSGAAGAEAVRVGTGETPVPP